MSLDRIIYRQLDGENLGQVVSLHREVIRSLLDKSFLYRREPEFFEALLAGDGAIVGAFADAEELVAYVAVISPSARRQDSKRRLGHLGIDIDSIAIGGGIAVHPGCRRSGLMRSLINERRVLAQTLGARYVAEVVSPSNETSFRAFHQMDHAVAGVHLDEDGENYLMIESILTDFSPVAEADVEIPLLDHERNLAILREGRLIGLPATREGEPVFSYVSIERVFGVGGIALVPEV